MEPAYVKRRAVLWISLQAEPVPPIDHVVAAPLRARAVRLVPLLLALPGDISDFVFIYPLGGLRGTRRPGGGGARAPRRKGIDACGQEAGFCVWGRHSIEAGRAASAERLPEPAGVRAAVERGEGG